MFPPEILPPLWVSELITRIFSSNTVVIELLIILSDTQRFLITEKF